MERVIQIRVRASDHTVPAQAPSESPSDRLCLMCSKHGEKTCNQCHEAAYCSPECQKKDWKAHKHVCQTFAQFANSARPSKHYVRSLIFPADSKVPRWIWLRAKDNCIKAHAMTEHIGDLGDEDNLLVTNMHGDLAVECKGMAALSNQSQRQPNESVLALGKLGQLHIWPGPILIVGFLRDDDASVDKADGCVPSIMSDLNMRDYRNAIDGFLVNGMNPCVAEPSRFPYEKLLAVKMTCLGERMILATSMKPIETCIIPVRVPLNCAQWACAFPFMLGLPWVCRVLTPDCWDDPDRIKNSVMDNVEANLLSARFLFGYGDAGLKIHCAREPGTVFIMDMYGQPIHQAHIRALSVYLKQNAEIKFENKDPWVGRAEDGTSARPRFDREHFEEFWVRLKGFPWGDDTVNENTPSPYDRSLEPLIDNPILVSQAEMSMFGKVLLNDEPVQFI